MPKADLEKITLNLRPGDFALIRERFPKQGASAVVRQIIAKWVDEKLSREPRMDDETMQELMEQEMELDV